MKKRLFAGLLALCMTVNLMSATAFAEDSKCLPECTTEEHADGCPVAAAEETVICAGAETEGECLAEEHVSGCSKYVVPCTKTAECVAKNHDTDCALYVVPCTNDDECMAEEHTEGCPADVVYVQCSTEGCELMEGHPGECTGAGVYDAQQEKPKVLPNAKVNSLGAITVGSDNYPIESYYVYDLLGNSGGSKLTEKDGSFPLQIAMQFIAEDTKEEAETNAYGDYTTDFFIKFQGLSGESFVGDECYIAGYYPSFDDDSWVVIPLDGFPVENNKVYPVITSAGFDFKYTDICASVQDFSCGIYIPGDIIKANPNLTVELKLGLSENIDAALNANFETVDGYVYTANDILSGVTNTGVASIGKTKYTSLESAYAAAEAGNTITLLEDIETSTVIKIEKPITIDGQNKYSVTGTAQKTFEVYSNATFENLEIVNNNKAGRCVDTRKDVEVNILNCELYANGTNAYTQPLTIGGSENGTKVVVKNTTISSGPEGKTYYAVISFVESDITIENSVLNGWAALYMNDGSAGSEVIVNNSKLNGVNKYSGESDNFGTIVLQDNNISVAVKGTSEINATKEAGAKQFVIALAGDGKNNIVDVESTTKVNGELIVANYRKADSHVIKLPSNCANKLIAENYVYTTLSDGRLQITDMCEGHSFADKTITAASCSGTGVAHNACTKCGLVKEVKTLSARGHKMEGSGSDGSGHWSVCTRCGATGSKSSHSYSNGKCSCGHTVKVEVYVPETPAPAPAPTPAPTTPTQTTTTTKPAEEVAKPVEEAAKPVETPVEEVVVDTKIVEEVASEEVKEAVKETVTVAETKEVEKETGTVTEVKVAVTTETVDKVIENTEAGATVILPLTEVAEEGQAVTEAEVAVEALEKIVEAEAALTVEFEGVKVTFESETIKAIAEQAKGSTIELRVVPVEHHELNEEQQTVLEEHDVAVRVSAQLFSDGEYIGDFKGGKARIAIPFTPEEGKAPEHHKVYFVDDNGEMTLMPAVYVDGHMVFETNHFSDYVIVYEEVAEVEEEAAVEEEAVVETVEEETEKAGLPIVPIIIIVVAIILVVAFVATRRKNDEE